jgi:hypothetical protein
VSIAVVVRISFRTILMQAVATAAACVVSVSGKSPWLFSAGSPLSAVLRPTLLSLYFCVFLSGFTQAQDTAQPLSTAERNREIHATHMYHSFVLANRYPGLHAEAAAVEDSSGIDALRLWLVGGSLVAANTAIMIYYFATFYNDEYAERAPFHTFNDWYNSDLNVDKLGHIWGAQIYTRLLYRLFRWTGMSDRSSMYWSSGGSMLFQLEMEITDGLYRDWGFSWWDMAANTVGAVWPNLQRIYPELQVVNLKMSYRPSDAVKKGWIKHDYLRDYDGFTYWLTLSVHDILPESWKPWWPGWLGLAVGYGAENTMLGKNIYNSRDGRGQGDQQWYIALDYDLRKLPGDSAFLRFLKEELNMFHWPSPAVRFSSGTVWYGLFF